MYEVYYKDKDHIPCLIEAYSGSYREQLLKITRRFIFHYHHHQTKKNMVDLLLRTGFTETDILNLTYFQPSQRSTYFYNPYVPNPIITRNEQAGRPSSIATINQITKLRSKHNLSDNITSFLYEKSHKRTLTHEQLKSFTKMLLNTDGFQELTNIQQRKTLQFVLCNQAFLIKEWQKKINNYLDQNKNNQ